MSDPWDPEQPRPSSEPEPSWPARDLDPGWSSWPQRDPGWDEPRDTQGWDAPPPADSTANGAGWSDPGWSDAAWPEPAWPEPTWTDPSAAPPPPDAGWPNAEATQPREAWASDPWADTPAWEPEPRRERASWESERWQPPHEPAEQSEAAEPAAEVEEPVPGERVDELDQLAPTGPEERLAPDEQVAPVDETRSEPEAPFATPSFELPAVASQDVVEVPHSDADTADDAPAYAPAGQQPEADVAEAEHVEADVAEAEPVSVSEPEPASEPAAVEPTAQPSWEPIDRTPWSPEPPADRFAPELGAPARGEPPVASAAAAAWSTAPDRPWDAGSSADTLSPVAASIATRVARGDEEDWDGETDRRRPTTAEQAVPWLIGVILLLAGMVIVLLALIFTSDNGALANPILAQGDGALSGGTGPDAAGSGAPAASPAASAAPAASSAPPPASVAPAATAEPTATPLPYGALEMVYLGRSAALAPIYLLHRDFTTEAEPTVLAQAPDQDIERLAWAADGTHGAAIVSGILVSIEPGETNRELASGMSAAAFSADGATLYAVAITEDGANDTAEVLAIDFASGETSTLASASYPRPEIGAEAPVEEAQFVDDGGAVRIYRMADGKLRLWILGAPTYEIEPGDGSLSELSEPAVPVLWSPDGKRRIELREEGSSTRLILRDQEDKELAMTSIVGLVSHLRWAPDGSQVVFTLGTTTSAGGVVQDLHLWNLNAGADPQRMTNTGAAFGAEWLGAAQSWAP